MSEKKIGRRSFLKTVSLAGISLPTAHVVGKIGNYEIISSEGQYGGFLIKRHQKDDPPYDVDDAIYQRFDSSNTAFARFAGTDPEYQEKCFSVFHPPPTIMEQNLPGFSRLDYELAFASWVLADVMGSTSSSGGHGLHAGLYQIEPFEGFRTSLTKGMPRWERGSATDEDIATYVKKAAKLYGASLVGIAELDERWLYSRYFDSETASYEGEIRVTDDVEKPQYLEDGTLAIPRSMNKVIVMAFEMDFDGIATSHSAVEEAATGNGYSRMSFTTACLAQFIRALGFNALPCGNNTGLSVPMAIDAGLGEFGRNGCLITPKYGARVRLSKIITDMPMAEDSPISFGVLEFCEVCGKCAEACPASAIRAGERTREGNDRSNNPGTLKWPIVAGDCLNIWMEVGMMGCSNCIRSCPFNKPEGWLHDATRILTGMDSGPLDKLLLKLDDASGYGQQADPLAYWEKDSYVHIKD
jgi:reductive dehalogenase